jgi:arginase
MQSQSPPPLLALIGAASGWGAGFRQTEDGPPALRDAGLDCRLAAAGFAASWTAMIEPERRWRDWPDASTEEVFSLVARHNAALADAVEAAMRGGRLPIAVGGDHSVAIGTWGGVARAIDRQPLGLIWFDAHLDAHTEATTPSMNPHGMSAAVLLGHGRSEFLAVGGHAVRPENLCYIGARSYEDGERALLERLGVRVIGMNEVRARGLAAVVDEAIAIASWCTTGFGATIDLDGFDPADAPGVGLREPDGLRRDEMLQALPLLRRKRHGQSRLLALEIVEYIPAFDEQKRTARLVGDSIMAALGHDGIAESTEAA